MSPRTERRLVRTLVRCALLSLACGTMASKCERAPEAYRGAGLEAARLPVDGVVGAYRAVVGSAFTLGDPTLSLLVDPVFLPRDKGLVGGDSMPAALRSALQRQGLVKGTCQLPVQVSRTPLVCRAQRPGYVVRFSEPLALGDRTDSVQVHVVVQQYAIPGGPVEVRLRFERAYHVVRRAQTWRAVGEARLAAP